jgi:hypothetical protein
MKLLIGGKNRNIHFRKDNSAFYKSNGQENDVSHLFKKTGGGLKKQYEEYLVSENDLTERYKALNISGGGSKSPKKKVVKADKSSKSSKAVRDTPIKKKKNRGKKFLGGMTINGISIDIGGAGGTLDDRFNIYIKLLGAYYLALLSDLEPSLFIKTNETAVENARSTKEFHRNKLKNLLLMDFMEKDQDGDGRYLPYPRENKLQNLVFCHKLLESVKKHKQALKTANPANPAFNHIMINYIFHKALNSSNTVDSVLSEASFAALNDTVGGAPANPVFDIIPAIAEIPAIVRVVVNPLSNRLQQFAGPGIYTNAEPVPAPVPAGPDIRTDISNYILPACGNPVDCASIKEQLYRVIIADYRYLLALRTENRIDVGLGPAPAVGSIAELNTVLVHSLFQVKYADISEVNIDSADIITDFETEYVKYNSEVSNRVFTIAAGAGLAAADVTDVAGGPGVGNNPVVAPNPLTTPANNIFKDIPYKILSDYISANAVVIPNSQADPAATPVMGVFNTYYNTLLLLPINMSRGLVVNAQDIGAGLFAPNIPDVL